MILIGCAKEGFPPGGPEDRTPPKIIRTIPMVGQTNVDTTTDIEIWFSEGIQSSSALNSVFISPYSGENGRIKCRGQKITISFLQPMKSDRTYVITLGTGIKDYRNNPLAASYTIAFSTGETLDEGEIKGKIFDIKDATGIDVWAYRLEDNPDPNPVFQKADYAVQSDAGGQFLFSYLSPGEYRLFAIRDRLSDRLYQPAEEEIGITYRDAVISIQYPFNTDSLFFKMATEDTVGPSLIRAVPSNRNHLVLQFDEPISIPSQMLDSVITIISDEKTDDTLMVNHIYSDPVNKQRLHVITQDQDPEKQYRISVYTIIDIAGNPIVELYRETAFKGSGEADTTRPSLVQTIPQANDPSVSLGITTSLIFNDAMDSTKFEEGFSLSDSSGQSIAGSIRWMNPAEMLYQLNEPFKSQTMYTIKLSGEHVSDMAGNPIADTLFQFHTLNQDTLSSILGSIIDSSVKDSGNIVMYAKQIENPEFSYTQILPEPGPYHFSDILPGHYLIECYRDNDGNGVFSRGSVFPFQFSERFYVYPDTMTVRSRWPNEGNDFKLP